MSLLRFDGQTIFLFGIILLCLFFRFLLCVCGSVCSHEAKRAASKADAREFDERRILRKKQETCR